jgi:CRISPR system Cascade subunit CasA
MNLVTDPWIPIVTIEGKPEFASLMQIFSEGDKYADLSVRPHERVALMRLLICIAQAALDGPEDKDDWKFASKKLPDAVNKYLKEWNDKEAFELFHDSKPFLQIAALKPKEKEYTDGTNVGKIKLKLDKLKIETFTSLSKLDISLATGANSTLFDHQASSDENRLLDDIQIAIGLITYQNFSASGRIGVAVWNDIDTPGKGASFPAPSIDKLMIHSFLRGKNLLQTICLNLLTKPAIERHFGKKEAWGKPIWENFPNGFNDEIAIQNATDTYLGRLTPLARAVKIRRQEKDLLLANGLKYPLSEEGRYETSATIKIRENKRIVLKVNSNAIWRELHAIIVRNADNNNTARGPRALENLTNEDFDLWCGGIEWTTKGGYINSVESVYNVSSKMLFDACRIIYQNEVAQAEHISTNLGWAIEEYRKNVDGYWETRSDPKKNKKAFQDKDLLRSKATRSYWTAIEKQRYFLMNHIDSWQTESFDASQKAWRSVIHKSAREAYISACGQETPREIRAFALGWKKLFMEKKNDNEDPNQNLDGGEE